MENNTLRITLAQYDVIWEDKVKNLEYIEHIASITSGQTDIILLPEMCTTAFTFNVKQKAETVNDQTISRLKQIATQHNVALCGSFLCKEDTKYYNRGFFITPDSTHYYDKRHLFMMGEEAKLFTAGRQKLVFPYKGFNICLLVCYDLRFPVWTRNVNNEYDVLLFPGNWPEGRKEAWTTLLKARAVENISYVCGVNRTGKDKNGMIYAGLSMAINPWGQAMNDSINNVQSTETITLNKELLLKMRNNFPTWKDADEFTITI